MRAWIYAFMIVTAGVTLAQVSAPPGAGAKDPLDDRAAIERLHRQDMEATLSGKADDFAKLWTEDAIRMEPGGPAEVGKAAIYAEDKRQEMSSHGAQVLSYKPDIRDVKIVDGWAFEWGYFEGSFKPSADAKPVTFRGKMMRVLQRQPDGSWKFARGIWNTAESKPAGEQK